MQFLRNSKNFIFTKVGWNTNVGVSDHKVTGNVGKTLTAWETIIMRLQEILIWDSPVNSLSFLILISLGYWNLQMILEFSFVSLLCVGILLFYVINEWLTTIWPEISIERNSEDEWTTLNPHLMTLNEIDQFCNKIDQAVWNIFQKCKSTRNSQPKLFCAYSVTMFSLLGIIGHIIPGTVLIYIIVVSFLTVPGIIVHIPANYKNKILEICNSLFGDKQDTYNQESDFMPVKTEFAQKALEIPFLSDQTLESEYDSFSMPSARSINLEYSDDEMEQYKFSAESADLSYTDSRQRKIRSTNTSTDESSSSIEETPYQVVSDLGVLTMLRGQLLSSLVNAEKNEKTEGEERNVVTEGNDSDSPLSSDISDDFEILEYEEISK